MSESGGAQAGEPKVLVVYWSATGNTEKVARAIEQGVRDAGGSPTVLKTTEAAGLDFYDYDLVFMGVPSYNFMVPEPVRSWLKERFASHQQRGDVKLRAPVLPGKRAVVVITYSGPHTGIDEAIPAGKNLGQFFAHIGYEVVGEWYVIGEFHGKETHSTQGRLGDIRGRPNAEDLAKIRQQAAEVTRSGARPT